ncbi:MAG: hypothetical protein JNM99_03000 [Verrucomicrobiaceae bacterium]|nr:hypothetical protein [Verrucomicrobiaceae bacterium]
MIKNRTPSHLSTSNHGSKPLLDTVPNSITIAAMRFLSPLVFVTMFFFGNAVRAAAPVVTTHPTTTTVASGTSVSFTADASGSPTVQWQSKAEGASSFSDISGATATTYSATATGSLSGTQFRAVFTNADGTATSNAATLTVTTGTPAAPAVQTNPSALTRVAGDTAAFVAAASGNPTPTVQWQISTNNGSTWTNITDSRFSGATSNTLQFTSALSDSGSLFRAVYTNSLGTKETSSAKLTVTSSTTPTPETPQGTNTQGVLVYNLNFKHLAGFGIDFFEDGYVVLPATGGTGEVLFLGRDNGKRIYSKQTGAKSFTGKTRDDTYTVVTMNGTSGASLCMHAYGKADDKVKANTPTVSISVKTARTMHGIAQAAYDESTATTKPLNGTLGFVEFSEMKLVLDEGETNRVNENSLSVVDAMKTLVVKVTARGYTELKLTTSTTTTTTGSTTGTTTGSTSTDSTTDSSSTTTTK